MYIYSLWIRSKWTLFAVTLTPLLTRTHAHTHAAHELADCWIRSPLRDEGFSRIGYRLSLQFEFGLHTAIGVIRALFRMPFRMQDSDESVS